jgi:hypothetical protein
LSAQTLACSGVKFFNEPLMYPAKSFNDSTKNYVGRLDFHSPQELSANH